MLAKTDGHVAEFIDLEDLQRQVFNRHEDSFQLQKATELKYINNSTVHETKMGHMMEPSKSTSSSAATSCIHTSTRQKIGIFWKIAITFLTLA